MIVHTIGHSTRPIDDFLQILSNHRIKILVDIRAIPRSRRNPQFNIELLPDSLKSSGIDYVHMKTLGGLRHPKENSINAGWNNLSFRGYADYMQTEEFCIAIQELVNIASHGSVAVMCAEAVPWRCHRRMVSDALVVRGFEVINAFDSTHSQRHVLTKWARVKGFEITYQYPSKEI